MDKETSSAMSSRQWPTVMTADGSFDLLDESDKQILIVDDEESVRTLFASCLSERYPCSTAASAEEALTQLASMTYALVITDIIMPGRSGIELLREITTRFPDTAVIMASAIDRTQRVLDAVRLGAFDYILKPCDLDVLELCVERALERRSLLQTARTYKQNLERQNRELASRKAELERLQAQLVQSEKMASLGQLAAGIAHELNNPAGFIYGNMDMLRECAARIKNLFAFYDALSLSPEVAAQAAMLKANLDYENLLLDLAAIITDCGDGSQRICDVVQNLRLFSRLDEAEFKKIDLHEGIDSTIRLLSRYYNSGHIILRRNYGVLPPVSCYAGQLNQVWMNLLVNAAQAVNGNGEVSITTSLKDAEVQVSISDNGCGIASEHLQKIFDPFFTTKPVGEGTGLGLSIIYGIIERHGGSISVESTIGKGTDFHITIPVETIQQNTASGV
ncbi:MAG TPA: ATP-binding protein [Pyrinomonadaceae bacterium]|jgi:signal transduction histidine kinase